MNKFINDEYNISLDTNNIANDLYDLHNVKKGLRNPNGTGVLVLLTKIADVYGYKTVEGNKVDDEGHLYYRGYDLKDIAKIDRGVNGYEKTCFLLLFGRFPNEEELVCFSEILAKNYELPNEFLENCILKNTSKSVMNQIQRSVLSLYSYDDNPDDVSPLGVLEKGLSLLAKMPAIMCYSYQAKKHYIDNKTLHIRRPRQNYTFAENILLMARKDGRFTNLEADTLDLLLIIHAEHGGGNNSTFANIVVSSTGTDLYSAMVSSLGSLKGPRHGGASNFVDDMMQAVIKEIGLDASDEKITNIINRILDKDFFDNSGLIYGIGHAVYTKSDPRTDLLKVKAYELAKTMNQEHRVCFYDKFATLSIIELKKRKAATNSYCANVDFYSGLTYRLLNIPSDLFTPIFATSRMIGWLAHNIENKLYCNKIIRPAAKYVGEIKKIEE